MKTLQTVLIASAMALASTVAFAQNGNDQTKAPHNAGTDQGTKKPAQAAPSGTMTTGAGVTAPGSAKVNSSTNAEINKNNLNGARPGENTGKPGDIDKSR